MHKSFFYKDERAIVKQFSLCCENSTELKREGELTTDCFQLKSIGPTKHILFVFKFYFVNAIQQRLLKETEMQTHPIFMSEMYFVVAFFTLFPSPGVQEKDGC